MWILWGDVHNMRLARPMYVYASLACDLTYIRMTASTLPASYAVTRMSHGSAEAREAAAAGLQAVPSAVDACNTLVAPLSVSDQLDMQHSHHRSTDYSCQEAMFDASAWIFVFVCLQRLKILCCKQIDGKYGQCLHAHVGGFTTTTR